MAARIYGRHLWAVTLTGVGPKLWITTEKNDLKLAAQKAQTFSRKYASYRGKTITQVEHRGTLDA
jgi:hypothetical protein